MKSQVNAKLSYTLWQETATENVPESPLIVECYHGTFTITQEQGKSISLNYETIPDLIRFLKTIREPQ